ncbi:hypothetical protein [Streptomyces sp. 4F14]|uniref:hypothetical protein n=1 Tax=Streptomyces sp. 4F14 TaxID=3394380 RepID=UPI003A8543D4
MLSVTRDTAPALLLPAEATPPTGGGGPDSCRMAARPPGTEAGGMQRQEQQKKRRSLAGGWEGILLSLAAGFAVLAVIRPDLYGGLIEGFATTVTALAH